MHITIHMNMIASFLFDLFTCAHGFSNFVSFNFMLPFLYCFYLLGHWVRLSRKGSFLHAYIWLLDSLIWYVFEKGIDKQVSSECFTWLKFSNLSLCQNSKNNHRFLPTNDFLRKKPKVPSATPKVWPMSIILRTSV